MTSTLDIYSIAVDLYHVGRLDEALTTTETALAASPDDGRLWELKGLVHRSRSECGLARAALETATLFVPLQPTARCALADCYAHAGPVRLAYEMYRSLLEADDTPPDLLLPIASGLDRVGASRLALQVCREAARREPDCPRAWHDLASYLRECGFPPRLILAAARKAVDLAPEEGRYRLGLVALLHQFGNDSEAAAVASRLRSEQIAEACCRCCLARVAEICYAAGNLALAAACRRRIKELPEYENPQT